MSIVFLIHDMCAGCVQLSTNLQADICHLSSIFAIGVLDQQLPLLTVAILIILQFACSCKLN